MQKALLAARAVLLAHGIAPDRADILQDAHTLVVRLTSDLVARVVQRLDGTRQGTAWFERENAVAAHLTRAGAPVIPLHPGLPAGPHSFEGFPMNFWEYVEVTEAPLNYHEAGARLAGCHRALRSLETRLPTLAILEESLVVASQVKAEGLLEQPAVGLLRGFLLRGLAALRVPEMQALHGDAHTGNLLHTTRGLLWTDWEDAFAGPVEWDVASAVWNARFLEEDMEAVAAFRAGYEQAGGVLREEVLEACFEARAAVICVWYPVLYPRPDAVRRQKLDARLRWLAQRAPTGAGS